MEPQVLENELGDSGIARMKNIVANATTITQDNEVEKVK